MRSAKIFLVGDTENQLAEMVETPFDKEDILQVLLERYPDLLPGDQINPEDPRRWLLISREMGIPGKEQGGNIWSLDHLFIDQDGIPTFVECKRAADTRARREVVAQMLDYAANGTMYWSIDALRQSAGELAIKRGRNLDEDIQELVASDEPVDIDKFWKDVELNLRKGRVRLIFVADRTPQELRRLVEFLNEKMNDVEVLAVEIKQFLGKGNHKAIVPRIVGLSESAREVKTDPSNRTRHTTRTDFLSACNPEATDVFSSIFDQAKNRELITSWGTVGFSIRYVLPKDGSLASFLYGYPPNKIEFYVAYLPLDGNGEKELRQYLSSLSYFKDAGKKTLRAEITPTNCSQILGSIDQIYEKVKQLVEHK